MALRAEDIDLAADRELVERWQAGEHDAFDDLYTRYFDRLTSFCQRRVGSRDAAEEIAQEAFVKALQALPRFAGERRFYPWVTVIAGRLCVDHHRRLGRVRPSDDIDPGTVDGDHGARLAFLADVDNLDRALRRLGPRHLQVLELREREGMTYQQIAEHLEVPQSTVEALLFRARKALRREFMAVSGEGRLASIPLLGYLLRKTMAWRDRVADALPSLSQLAGPVAAGAMAVAMTAAPFGHDHAHTADVVAGRSPVRVATTSTPLVAAPLLPPVPPASVTSGGRARTAPPPIVRTMDSHDAAAAAAAMPVNTNVGPLTVGVSPAAVVDEWLPAVLDLLEDPE